MSTSPELCGITAEVLPQGRIAYAQIPGPRDQDVIRIVKPAGGITVASVIDGWNLRELGTNEPGKEFAAIVAKRFPEIFLYSKATGLKKQATLAARALDREMQAQYPRDVSCVGSFLFMAKKQAFLVTIGSVFVLVWDGKRWYRPKAIGDYSLDPQKYPSDVSRFIGRGELKNDPFYSSEPDVVVFPKGRIIFVGTDGLEDLFTVDEFNSCVRGLLFDNPKEWVFKLRAEIEKMKSCQKDDVSFLLKV